MFDHPKKYSKERVLVFLKYLTYAAARQLKEQPIEKPMIRKTVEVIHKKPVNLNPVEKRISEISEKRRTEIETKIKMHYTQNKLLPYEERLKKLRRKYHSEKRKKHHSQTKLKKIKTKIDKCAALIKELKKSQISRH